MLKTRNDIYYLTEGEIFDGDFSNKDEVDRLCGVGIIEKTNESCIKPVIVIED